MTAHEDLVRALTVERFTTWTPTTTGTSTAAHQLARAMAHERRRPQRARPDSRRRTPQGDTIDGAQETS
jgi:hypothetical protein